MEKKKDCEETPFDFPDSYCLFRPLFWKERGPYAGLHSAATRRISPSRTEMRRRPVPQNESLHTAWSAAKEKRSHSGLPGEPSAGGRGEKERSPGGLQRDGSGRARFSAPIVIGRSLDTGSVGSPNRETEAMLEGRMRSRCPFFA